ncbi:tripartite tricarboxylate transporter substrate binding protein [Bosea sp. Tri-44]|uniref:Bug family tripartite tricarboxylate transporter substrate binding protein n=1 Tax=Bosea sp. Tri-44 TaxID=1972137 RepID=UPI0020BEAD94|nr:tripartite tricarboxylate transporter substrate binding protein [Bosea sp. Tri-44]
MAAAAFVPAAVLRPGTVFAQAYPSRPVKLISPYAAGGATDIIARFVGQWIGERLNGSFFVENRAGSGSNIGTEAALRSDPDGYTLLLASTANAVNATLYPKLKFDFLRDSEPVGMIGTLPNVLVIHPSVPVKTLPEFIAYAKANASKLSVGLPGIGSPQHLSAALFQTMTGIDLPFLQYKGGGPVINDLIGGHVQASFASSASSAEYIRAGTLRGIAVTSAKRLEILPDLPAISELLPGYEATNFYGLSAPKGTPQPVIEALSKELNAGLANRELVAKLAPTGLTPHAMSPAEFGALIASETEKWRKVIKSAGITMD